MLTTGNKEKMMATSWASGLGYDKFKFKLK